VGKKIMPSTFKKFIESLAHGKAPGPSTTFSMFHIFLALELMAEKPIGRNKLADKLNVGDGAIRTIISRLKDAGLILPSKEGCHLTEKGLKVWKQFKEFFPERAEIGKTELTTAEYNYGFLVKNSGHKVKSGIEQRDAAIMGGARRAIENLDGPADTGRTSGSVGDLRHGDADASRTAGPVWRQAVPHRGGSRGDRKGGAQPERRSRSTERSGARSPARRRRRVTRPLWKRRGLQLLLDRSRDRSLRARRPATNVDYRGPPERPASAADSRSVQESRRSQSSL